MLRCLFASIVFIPVFVYTMEEKEANVVDEASLSQKRLDSIENVIDSGALHPSMLPMCTRACLDKIVEHYELGITLGSCSHAEAVRMVETALYDFGIFQQSETNVDRPSSPERVQVHYGPGAFTGSENFGTESGSQVDLSFKGNTESVPQFSFSGNNSDRPKFNTMDLTENITKQMFDMQMQVMKLQAQLQSQQEQNLKMFQDQQKQNMLVYEKLASIQGPRPKTDLECLKNVSYLPKYEVDDDIELYLEQFEKACFGVFEEQTWSRLLLV